MALELYVYRLDSTSLNVNMNVDDQAVSCSRGTIHRYIITLSVTAFSERRPP